MPKINPKAYPLYRRRNISEFVGLLTARSPRSVLASMRRLGIECDPDGALQWIERNYYLKILKK